jgi:ABC-type glycerol-3-phosphate transport system permease component
MRTTKNRMTIKNIIASFPKQFILIIFSILSIYPVYYMATTAFKTRPDWLHNQFGLPNPFTFQNITDALIKGEIPLWFGNSLIVTIAVWSSQRLYRHSQHTQLLASAFPAGRFI